MGTLLIIDDSASVREELISILTADGKFNRFLQASDGVSGLKIFSDPEQDVDVVCCDLNMPQMDGYQFLRLGRANPSLMNTPIIMLTSESDVSDVVKAFELGANDFISKPFIPSILKVRLNNMLHIKHLQDLLKAQRGMMEEMATRDSLTNLANLRSFRLSFEEEFNRSMRYEDPLSILMADLDRFKIVNDTYGHPRGDAVLKKTASIMLEVMRKVDFVARYGGEEFVVIMPHTDTNGALRAAERLRVAIESCHFDGLPAAGDVTVSIGVATLVEGVETDMDGLVNQADKALYRAKMNGRNRVEKHSCESAEKA
ncbi:MAG: diguanylate cyclase [bacterium]|nr:diguanylate cyclase [bacterium]MDT8365210.1 diguanylate cyclase [bacterium]